MVPIFVFEVSARAEICATKIFLETSAWFGLAFLLLALAVCQLKNCTGSWEEIHSFNETSAWYGKYVSNDALAYWLLSHRYLVWLFFAFLLLALSVCEVLIWSAYLLDIKIFLETSAWFGLAFILLALAVCQLKNCTGSWEEIHSFNVNPGTSSSFVHSLLLFGGGMLGFGSRQRWLMSAW